MTPEPSPDELCEVATTDTTLGSTVLATDSTVPPAVLDVCSLRVCWVSAICAAAGVVPLLESCSSAPKKPPPSPATRASATVVATSAVRRPRPRAGPDGFAAGGGMGPFGGGKLFPQLAGYCQVWWVPAA